MSALDEGQCCTVSRQPAELLVMAGSFMAEPMY